MEDQKYLRLEEAFMQMNESFTLLLRLLNPKLWEEDNQLEIIVRRIGDESGASWAHLSLSGQEIKWSRDGSLQKMSSGGKEEYRPNHLCAPISDGQNQIGFLELGRPELGRDSHENEFTTVDRQMVLSIAGYLSLRLERDRLKT